MTADVPVKITALPNRTELVPPKRLQHFEAIRSIDRENSVIPELSIDLLFMTREALRVLKRVAIANVRADAEVILTYQAKDAARWLK